MYWRWRDEGQLTHRHATLCLGRRAASSGGRPSRTAQGLMHQKRRPLDLDAQKFGMAPPIRAHENSRQQNSYPQPKTRGLTNNDAGASVICLRRGWGGSSVELNVALDVSWFGERVAVPSRPSNSEKDYLYFRIHKRYFNNLSVIYSTKI